MSNGEASGQSSASFNDLRLAERTILVLGSPRSGTTWLAKLLDSHPDVLYRHEPDEVLPPTSGSDPRVQLWAWINERSLRVSATPPFFAKSWRPAPLAVLRIGMAQGLKALSRLTGNPLIRAKVPEFISIVRQPRLRPVLKLVDWDARPTLRTIPQCRGLFILRHPCGQIASVMRGTEQGWLERLNDLISPIGEHSAMMLAASRGIETSMFHALPPAAKLAWSWLSFNEIMLTNMESVPNARLVLYEDLCANPGAVTRELFDFAGLEWHSQTEKFLLRSTDNNSRTDYYAVFRSTAEVVDRWRQTMLPADQEAVRMVIQTSPVARYWADLSS